MSADQKPRLLGEEPQRYHHRRVYAVELENQLGQWREVQAYPDLLAAEAAFRRFLAMRPARTPRLAIKDVWHRLTEDGQ